MGNPWCEKTKAFLLCFRGNRKGYKNHILTHTYYMYVLCIYKYIYIYIVCVYTYIVYINIYIYNYIDTYIHMHYIYYIYDYICIIPIVDPRSFMTFLSDSDHMNCTFGIELECTF